MDDAVAAAVKATNPASTLIVVTADHAHTTVFAGYPTRGNDILGEMQLDLHATLVLRHCERNWLGSLIVHGRFDLTI